ncbi:SDR family oxidoreductase [Rhizobium leguminosarum]|uniref:SDR family oxidoreductase n=1 Tax=Rhizobium leguminosarum TaxID=384 RepID=UPI00102FE18D|nr:SDR family oxidoreductase [Rhizobium leguminosarum]NKJ99933.1 SDR family oxidoreductase [Rhizobium leguminosarum bv. viciae]QIO73170.1 SDR family oxidoreductase [Rhizobium leguminosarum bv. trifolii]QIO80189.1 SDR family oxidoreductase [Rhizobium leguminosarum bv. trifolii]TAU23321.1 SDR family oxidoreductase [Rhizobium leguminosarum]TAU43317.1 SDR family oxidoreductase [Rhizobium leguminosarum]
MSRLQNKTALITGGTSGIGLETARQFIAEGARVVVTGSSAASVEAARAEFGGKATVIQADAGNAVGQKAVADSVREIFGTLDILFVNAGVAEFGPLEQWSEAAFDKSVDINVKGPFFLIQALLPIFSKQAAIVLNTSINAHIGMPNSSVYSLTKGALLTLAKTLSGELIGRGIRVNAVSPGPISTPLYSKLGASQAQSEAMTAQIQAQIPVGRFGTPGEVAKTIVFLASDEAAYIVGSELIIDGGMSNL